MNQILNPIMNKRGCCHILHKPAKLASFTKNPRDPAPQVWNNNGLWVPYQEQNAFIFHKTTYDEQNYLSYRYQGLG